MHGRDQSPTTDRAHHHPALRAAPHGPAVAVATAATAAAEAKARATTGATAGAAVAAGAAVRPAAKPEAGARAAVDPAVTTATTVAAAMIAPVSEHSTHAWCTVLGLRLPLTQSREQRGETYLIEC